MKNNFEKFTEQKFWRFRRRQKFMKRSEGWQHYCCVVQQACKTKRAWIVNAWDEPRRFMHSGTPGSGACRVCLKIGRDSSANASSLPKTLKPVIPRAGFARGICFFMYFDKKQIPHFVRYDKFGAFPKLLGLIPFSRVTAQANGAELPSPMS